jgi:hypothetical protein
MLNKEKLVDTALEIAYTNPAHTILVKTYNKNGDKDVYASDYFIREVGNIITPEIWKVKMEIISDVVEGKWKVTGSQSFESNATL